MSRINQENIDKLDKNEIKRLLELLVLQELQWKYAKKEHARYVVGYDPFLKEQETIHKILISNINLASPSGEAICRYFRDRNSSCADCCVYSRKQCMSFLKEVFSKGKGLAFMDARILRKRLISRLEKIDGNQSGEA